MRRRDPPGKRAAVIDAASTLFQADGFEATSAAAIASTAGVSEGIVFHYFGSKHGVLEACSNAAAADFAGVEIKAHRDGIDYHRLVTQTFEWLAEDRMIRRLWSEGDDRIVGALRRGWQGGIVPAVASVLVTEQEAGRCRAGDTTRLARMQFAVMGEALTAHFDDPIAWPREDAVAETAALLRSLVAPA